MGGTTEGLDPAGLQDEWSMDQAEAAYGWTLTRLRDASISPKRSRPCSTLTSTDDESRR